MTQCNATLMLVILVRMHGRRRTTYLLRLGELLVRGAGRVDDQGLGVPHVGQLASQAHRIDELDPRAQAARRAGCTRARVGGQRVKSSGRADQPNSR